HCNIDLTALRQLRNAARRLRGARLMGVPRFCIGAEPGICRMQRDWRSFALVAVAVIVFLPPAVTDPQAQAAPPNFKVAFYNVLSGKGARPLAGHPSTFSDTTNCTDPTLPMNGWGHGVMQARLTNEVGSDPTIVALG